MTNEEKETKLKELLKDQDVFEVKSVDNVNHKPHPYCITDKHLAHNDSMYLGERQIRDMEKVHGPMCGMYGNGTRWINHSSPGYTRCNLRYEDHTSDCVAFLKLKRNCTKEEASEVLKSVVEDVKDTIDGFAFVETKEKFRIT